MAKHKEPRILEAAITSYSKDGFGLADNIEVPFTMPGDSVEVAVNRKRKGRYQGRMTSLLQASKDREEPLCKHFSICGGCRWQHVPYVQQQALKEKNVRAAFEGLALETQIAPIIGCEPPWYYRNKMEFSFSSDASGEHFLGLMMLGGRSRVLNLTECHLVSPWFIDSIKCTRDWWDKSQLAAYHPYRDTGSLRTLIVREGIHTGDRLVMLTVSGNPDFALSRPQLDAWVEAMQLIKPELQGSHLSLFLRIQQAVKGTPTSFYEILLSGPDHLREYLHLDGRAQPLQCKVSPSAFFQPNTKQAERLYSKAIEMAQLHSDSIVYDLFCGTGILGLAAAPFVKQVIGIEISHEAVLDARVNAAQNGIHNIDFFPGDVAKVLDQLQAPSPDLVIVDPPRVGLGEKALNHVLRLSPERILYVSCNPNSQAKDIALLMQAGYRVESVQPVDQFPQTVHIENIAVLIREVL